MQFLSFCIAKAVGLHSVSYLFASQFLSFYTKNGRGLRRKALLFAF